MCVPLYSNYPSDSRCVCACRSVSLSLQFITTVRCYIPNKKINKTVHYPSSQALFLPQFVTTVQYHTSLPQFVAPVQYHGSLPHFNATVHYHSSPPLYHCHGSLPQFTATVRCHGLLPRFIIIVHHQGITATVRYSSPPKVAAAVGYPFLSTTVRCHGCLLLFTATVATSVSVIACVPLTTCFSISAKPLNARVSLAVHQKRLYYRGHKPTCAAGGGASQFGDRIQRASMGA